MGVVCSRRYRSVDVDILFIPQIRRSDFLDLWLPIFWICGYQFFGSVATNFLDLWLHRFFGSIDPIFGSMDP